MAVLNTGLAKTSAATGYTIPYSCRFNGADDTYLNWTPASAGDTQKFSFSCWVKRSRLGAPVNTIITTGTSGAHYAEITFNAADSISLFDYEGGNTFAYASGAILRRDPTAWYHVLVAVDTTQTEETERVRTYINGVEQTSWSSPTHCALNDTLSWFNKDAEWTIGMSVTEGNQEFDGYMAEMHWIDGTQLAPTEFGEFGDYGEWKAIEVSGLTYGTNGFYLDFADSAALGNDVSGNDNDWTVTNLDAADQMLDSPTNNFCTWNPLLKHFGKTQDPIEGALKHVNGSVRVGAAHLLGSTMAVTTGKWYWEIMLGDTTYSHWSKIGIGSDIQKEFTELFGNFSETAGVPWASTWGWGYGCNNAQKMHGGESSATMSGGTSFASDASSLDVMAIAIDMDAGKIWFAENNVWLDSGDPAAGSNPAWDDVEGPAVACASTQDGSTAFVTANFGQDSSFAGEKTAQGNQDSNGIGDFYYEPPDGFLAMCTSNLPTPAVIPSEHFNTVLYTGSGQAGQSITGVGFQPDFVWTKDRSSSYHHALQDVLRGTGTDTHFTADNSAIEGDYTAYHNFASFDSDGFTIGATSNATSYQNHTGDDYVAWNWKANGAGSSNEEGSINTTATSANVDAGFSISTYTGTGSNATVGHGLSKAPEMVIVKNRDQNDGWLVYHSGNTNAPETDRLLLHTTGATDDSDTYWNDTAPTADVFSIGTAASPSGEAHIAYCFHSVEGYSRFGLYYGNDNDTGPFIPCGFRPAFVMIKGTAASREWNMIDSARNPTNGDYTRYYLYADSGSDESDRTYPIDFLSNGFKINDNQDDINATGASGEYIYMAFAETPFKYANAR